MLVGWWYNKDMIDVEILSKEELLMLSGKYIFHGSHALFEVCKPHKAQCGTHMAENEQTAIYGSDDLNFSVLFAFEKLPSEHFSWSADFVDGKWVGKMFGGTYIDDNDYGYLYVFDKAHFTPTNAGGSQFVCKKEIRPLKIIKVFYKDLKDHFISDTAKR